MFAFWQFLDNIGNNILFWVIGGVLLVGLIVLFFVMRSRGQKEE